MFTCLPEYWNSEKFYKLTYYNRNLRKYKRFKIGVLKRRM